MLFSFFCFSQYCTYCIYQTSRKEEHSECEIMHSLRKNMKSHKNHSWRRDCRYIQRARAAYGMEAEEEYKEFVKVKDKRYRSIWPDEDFRGYGSSGWKDNPGNRYRHQWEAKAKRDFENLAVAFS